MWVLGQHHSVEGAKNYNYREYLFEVRNIGGHIIPHQGRVSPPQSLSERFDRKAWAKEYLRVSGRLQG